MDPNEKGRQKELRNIFIKQFRNRTQKSRQARLNRIEQNRTKDPTRTENQEYNTN